MKTITLLLAAAALATAADLTLSKVTVLVKDQDEALKFYTEKLGFEKRIDLTGSGMRFVTVAPKGHKNPEVILLKASAQQEPRIGQGTTWVLDTADCRAAHAELAARGVKFVRPPEQTPWGVQAILQDLYGNAFALIERSDGSPR